MRRVWYQNCIKRCMGLIIANKYGGIPNSAAGIKNNVLNFKLLEIDCRRAQDKLYSWLLW